MKKTSLYFHINNGGVTLSVEDNGEGPCLVLKSSHFGHQTGRVSVNVKKDALGKVAAMFSDAAAMEYSPESSVVAETPRREDPKGRVEETAAQWAELGRRGVTATRCRELGVTPETALAVLREEEARQATADSAVAASAMVLGPTPPTVDGQGADVVRGHDTGGTSQ